MYQSKRLLFVTCSLKDSNGGVELALVREADKVAVYHYQMSPSMAHNLMRGDMIKMTKPKTDVQADQSAALSSSGHALQVQYNWVYGDI